MRRFQPRGPLALQPSAYGQEYPEARSAVRLSGSTAIVEIVGPLYHHADEWACSYDGIKAAVAEALEVPGARRVLLSIDSPGGLVAGCFDCVLELRAMAARAGKPIVAYVDSQATSAAYAIACAAERIYVPAAGVVGSIGVIDAMIDQTAADAAMGLRFAVVTSGARKADGHPHVAVSDAAIAAAQQHVDQLAELFFALVAERRPVALEAIRALQAGVVVGDEAVRLGLADTVATLDQTLALLEGAGTEAGAVPRSETQGEPPEAKTMNELIEALRALAADDGKPEDERSKARRMLAALDTEDKPEGEPEGDEKAEDKPDGEPDGDEVKPEAVSLVRALAAKVQRLEAEQRAALLATRSDLAPEVLAAVAEAPLELARKMLAALPRVPTGTVAAARAALHVAPQVSAAAPEADPEALELDRAMGLASGPTAIRREPHRVIFPALTSSEARALANRGDQ